MNRTVLFMLEVAQGPLFRFAFALMVLGLMRLALLGASDVAAAYVTTADRGAFWGKLGQRVGWFFFPNLVLGKSRTAGGGGWLVYHTVLFLVSLVFRLVAIIVPAFMAAHVYLWQGGFGITWPALPAEVADLLSLTTIIAGVVVFLGRLYSPMLRAVEPAWSFVKPLLLVLPFVTGMLARHPTWSPVDYHVVMLLHVLSASLVLVMLPFTRMLAGMHTPLPCVLPETAWVTPAEAGPRACVQPG